jgi:D-sedoheptulose 7-phosphate isomerase
MRRKRGEARGPLERQARTALREAARNMAGVERACATALAAAAEVMIACLESGGTAFFCGNGGSAADAQHLACELAGRYLVDRPGLAAVALTTNSSSLTAIGNDFGYDAVFARQLEGLGTPGDVLVAITTSGRSASVMRAVETAHGCGMTVIGFTGPLGRSFAAHCDLALIAPGRSTPRIQEAHITLGHTLCELVERALFARTSRGPARPARARGSARSASVATRSRRTARRQGARAT